MSEKVNFLYNSIGDTQATIRAIDVKIGFLFVIVMFPLTNISDIFKTVLSVYKLYEYWPPLIITTLIISWFVSAYSLLKSLVGISNPLNHVSGVNVTGASPNGIFYGGYLFKLGIDNVLYNASKTTSSKTIAEETLNLPQNEDEIIRELILEKIKVTYIREIKMLRAKYCINSIAVWTITGSIIWISDLIGK